jgi:hypothetical protein
LEELVSPAIPNYCNKKGGVVVPASVALDGPTSSKGTQKQKPFAHNNQLSYTGVMEDRARADIGHLNNNQQ